MKNTTELTRNATPQEIAATLEDDAFYFQDAVAFVRETIKTHGITATSGTYPVEAVMKAIRGPKNQHRDMDRLRASLIKGVEALMHGFAPPPRH